jgi:hypothetical protein
MARYQLFEVHERYGGIPSELKTDFGLFLTYGALSIVVAQWMKGKGGYHRVWRRGPETTKPNDWEKRKKGGRESAVQIVGVHMPDENGILFWGEERFLELYEEYRTSELSWKKLHPDYGFYTGHVQALERETGYEVLYVKVLP